MTHFHDWPWAMRSLSCAALVALLGLTLATTNFAQEAGDDEAAAVAEDSAAAPETPDDVTADETTDETVVTEEESLTPEPMAKPEDAASDEAPAVPTNVEEMTLEQKVDLLMASAIETNDDGTVKNSAIYGDTHVLWTLLAACLVFFMQAGFTLVEAGFTRAKNACNIVMKNVMDLSMGSIAFWLVGFGLMFGASASTGGFIGTTNFVYSGTDGFSWAFLLFQTVFAATAATIVSGAMAERTKFIGYLCYSVAICVIVYPIFGGWAWGSLADGGGWLEAGSPIMTSLFGEGVGFADFAGSTVVHSIGGWAALAGAIVVGARIGKFSKDGKPQPIPGHNIPLGALGVFILWLGWFGFNAGSTTAVGGGWGALAHIAVTTNLAAAGGAIAAMITSWILFKKPDPSFTLNGALAGLVGITAGCNAVSPLGAVCIGLIAGTIIVMSVLMFDKLKIDDPVGAISVHGVCGAWGTLAVGLFATEAGLFYGFGATQLLAQLVGIVAAFAWAFPVSLGIFLTIKYTVGLRVTEQEELEGLDVGEHGMLAYPPQMVTESFGGHPVYSPGPGMSPAGSPAVVHSSVPSTEGA